MPTHGIGERLGPTFFRLGVAALWAYACVVFLLEVTFDGIRVGLAGLAIIFAVGCALIIAATHVRLTKRVISPTRMFDLGVASLVLAPALLTADLVFTIRDNAARTKTRGFTAQEVRDRDSNIWHGELFPRRYAPTERDFFLYKPNVRLTGEVFGELYVPSMLGSRTLVSSVLERRRLSYFIGSDGLRELEPLSRSRIFALGDSFVFGHGTDEGKTWPDLLGASLGEPVYNLGVSASGPKSQLELLEYMLKANPESMHVRDLLWMIFEGNDLENSYAEMRPVDPPPLGVSALIEGTVLEALLSLPERVKSESVVRKLVRGELAFSARGQRYGQYQIDGVDLPQPLFHSSRFGYRLFVPADMEAATKPRAYVMNHPNRPLLDQTFRDMRALGQKSGFKVTVIIAPSDARLYGPAFDGFPALSPEPYFADYVAKLAGELGFSVVNLLELLQPFASSSGSPGSKEQGPM